MKRMATVLLLVVLALGGCATTVGTIPDGHSLEASGESAVVGRVEMVRPDGQPVTPALALLVGRMSLTAENETNGKSYVLTCDTRGFLSDFFVSLPPGRYRITKWGSANLSSQIQAWFDVAPRRVVYVGTLRFTGGRGPFLWQSGTWAVIDDPENSLRSFRERFPHLAQTVATSLMSLSGHSTIAAASAGPRPWLELLASPGQFPSAWVHVTKAGFTTLPGEGLVLALSLANKTDRTIWVAVGFISPPPNPSSQVIKKLPPQGADLFSHPQSTFLAETDYPVLVEVFLDESRTEGIERNETKFRFSREQAALLEKLAKEIISK